MRRLIAYVFVLLLATGLSFADAKKAKEKIKNAEAALEKHDARGAEKNLLSAIQEDPSNLDAHTLLGDLYSSTNRQSAAAKQYAAALALDDQQHKYNQDQRRRVIDQQGVTTALGGDLIGARDFYLAALAKDPDYAMYNYNLSCVYAEFNDLDSALPYLKKAWEHRDTMPSDIKFPDPRQDSSFKRFLDDKRFQDAVRDMVL